MPLPAIICRSVPAFRPFTILDLDSQEEWGGTSLSNLSEAKLAKGRVHSLCGVSFLFIDACCCRGYIRTSTMHGITTETTIAGIGDIVQ